MRSSLTSFPIRRAALVLALLSVSAGSHASWDANKPLFMVPTSPNSVTASDGSTPQAGVAQPSIQITETVIGAGAAVSTPAHEITAVDIQLPKPVAPAQVWTLRAGHLVQDELKAWAEQTQSTGDAWAFSWRVDRGWVIPASAQFTGSFDQAAEAVIRSLYEQGKPVRAEIWEGNRLFEVLHVDAR